MLVWQKRVWRLEQSWRIFSSHMFTIYKSPVHMQALSKCLVYWILCFSFSFRNTYKTPFLPVFSFPGGFNWAKRTTSALLFSLLVRKIHTGSHILFAEQRYHVFNKLQWECRSCGSFCSSELIKNLDSHQCSSMATPLFRDHVVQTLHSND